MREKHISNQNLAKIERSLFKSAQQNKTDLDKVLDSSELFNSIKKRINLENSATNNPKPHFAFPAFAFASVLVVVLLLFFGYLFVNSPQTLDDKTVLVSQPEMGFQPPIEEFQSVSDEKEQKISENKPRSFVENKKPKAIKPIQIIANEIRKAPLKTEKIKKSLPKPKKTLPEQSSPFYALNGVTDSYSLKEGLSIVRADFSREELSAMGVEVLNDIGESRVKAEVLIGNSGQPRAIRFLR